MKKLKALLINGSPRAKGCTYTALTELKNTLEQEGMEVELIHVGHKDVHGCIACRKCKEIGKCVFDDIVNEVAPKFNEADAFVIGAPVYYASPAGGAIAFLDRLFFSTANVDKSMKVGAAVTILSAEVVTQHHTMCSTNIFQSALCRLPQVSIGIWFTAVRQKRFCRIKRACKL